MTEYELKKTVAICDTQPITSEGLRTVIGPCPDLEFCETLDSLELATALVRRKCPDILIVDKGLGMHAVLDWLHDMKMLDTTPGIVIWGVSMTEAEALRFLQSGARGIIRKTADLNSLVACLRTVATGRSWMEDSVFRDSIRFGALSQVGVNRTGTAGPRTGRAGLQEQGDRSRTGHPARYREDSSEAHLRKTGVRGRYGLAITGLKEKGMVSLAN